MNIIDYLDFTEIYKKIKKIHFENYETKEEFIQDLIDMELDTSFVDGLYRFFDYDFGDQDVTTTSSENSCDHDVFDSVMLVRELEFEFSIGGNDTNESTNHNEWGYGYIIKIDLETEMFIGYREENYS